MKLVIIYEANSWYFLNHEICMPITLFKLDAAICSSEHYMASPVVFIDFVYSIHLGSEITFVMKVSPSLIVFKVFLLLSTCFVIISDVCMRSSEFVVHGCDARVISLALSCHSLYTRRNGDLSSIAFELLEKVF